MVTGADRWKRERRAAGDEAWRMPVAATTMMSVPVLIVIVMAAESWLLPLTAMANRPQEGIEGVRCDLSPFLAPRCVREAEMNPH